MEWKGVMGRGGSGEKRHEWRGAVEGEQGGRKRGQ